jgi:recombination protein RecA
MAKKKAEAETETSEKKEITTDLERKYGESAFISAEDFLNEKREVIPVSPKLDLILDGGIPEGSFVIIAGPPKIGKTVTSLHFAANAQKVGRKVFYLNIEGRLKPRDLAGISNLQHGKDQFEIVRSYVDNDGKSRILLAHEYLDVAERKVKDNPGCVVIVDSASQLLTETESKGELGEQHRAPGAVLLAQFCKRIANEMPVTKSIIIMIVHVVANTGGGMKRTSRTGGNKIQYAVDVDLECKYVEKWTVGAVKDDPDSGTEIGKKIHWTTGSTGGNAAPGMKTTSYLRYGVGIDEIYELYDLGKTLGLIERAGAWYTMSFLGLEKDTPKFQGEEKVITALNEHADWIELLRRKLKESLG